MRDCFDRARWPALAKLLTSLCLLTVVPGQPAFSREQWQIGRPDPAPTGPVGVNRQVVMPAQPGVAQTRSAPGFCPPLIPGLAAPVAPVSPAQVPGLAIAPAMPFTPAQVPGLATTPAIPGFSAGLSGQPAGIQVPGLVTSPSMEAPPPVAALPQLVPTGQGVLPDFFKAIVGKRLNMGTVLTGVLEDNLSTRISKRGDVFGITLPYGFNNQGDEIVPPNSRILGVVVDSFPARTQRAGMPGRLAISLRTLVFPDGRSSKIDGFIDHNPAHDQTKEIKTRFAGFNMSDYGQSVKGMLYSPVAGISWIHNRTLRGKEFDLKAGTPVSIKLNRSIDLAKMTTPVQWLSPSGVPGLAPGAFPDVAPESHLGAGGAPPALSTPPPKTLPSGSNAWLPPIQAPMPDFQDPNAIFKAPLSMPATGPVDTF